MTIFGRCVVFAACALTGAPAFAGEAITYYHNDLVGSPVTATDQAGYVRWRAAYRPYGDRDQTAAEQVASSDNSKWFTGHVHDDETGLTYAGARYYSPTFGRFLSVDPVGFGTANEQSFGRYTYANNNPYKFVDPAGRDIVLADLAEAAYFEKLINTRALGVFRFDGAGRLSVVSMKGDRSRHSAYYQSRLIAAINDPDVISLDKDTRYTSGAGSWDVDADTGGGLTDPRGRPIKVVVSGNSYLGLKDAGGGALRDDPADILAHELVGHAIPRTVGSDTGNAVDNENKVRRQVTDGGRRALDPSHTE
jgi:RHS repeat-associated protein